jgi:hypothetical protein
MLNRLFFKDKVWVYKGAVSQWYSIAGVEVYC